MRQLVSLVVPTFNEVENINSLFDAITSVLLSPELSSNYDFELIFIDNASTDGTVAKIKALCAEHKWVKLIWNRRNFGHIRSPYFGLLQSRGDCAIYLAADLQDPPSLIPMFLEKWRSGAEVVFGVKPYSETNRIVHWLRKAFYWVLDKSTDTPIVRNATGFGLYDKSVIEELRTLNDIYPYVRGLVCDLGYTLDVVEFVQPQRSGGKTKNNLLSLYDMAMLAFVNHSLLPIRIMSFLGLFSALLCMLIGGCYFVLKLLYWDSFPLGTAPLLLGFFLVNSVILVGIGTLGEYLAGTHRQVMQRPLVMVREWVNFE